MLKTEAVQDIYALYKQIKIDPTEERCGHWACLVFRYTGDDTVVCNLEKEFTCIHDGISKGCERDTYLFSNGTHNCGKISVP